MQDFLIIGAGINGMLLARELLAEGASVALIDKSAPGREASWAGGGIVSPLYPWRYESSITVLATWAQKYYPTLIKELLEETGIDGEFQQCGLLMLDATDESEALGWAQDNQHAMKKISGIEIYKREKQLEKGFASGLWMPNLANVRNPRLLQALAESLRKSSQFELLAETEFHGIRSESPQSVEADLLQGAAVTKIAAHKVIFCSGAWTGNLLSSLGQELDVYPVKGQMLLFKPEQQLISSMVLSKGRYLIPRQDGHLLVGSTLESVEYDKATTLEARDSLLESAITIVPALANYEIKNQWAGLRPATEKGVPYIGRLPGHENIFVNAGQYRNGLVLAPASTRLMTDLLLDRESFVDASPYALPESI